MRETNYTKILHFHPHFALSGGASSYLLEFADSLSLRGVKNVVITIKVPQDVVSAHPEITFVELHGPLTSSPFYWLFSPIIIIRLLLTFGNYSDYTVVCHAFPSQWWGALVKIFYGSKVVWIAHDPNYFLYNRSFLQGILKSWYVFVAPVLPIFRTIDQFFFPRFNYVFANSEYLCSELRSIYNFEKHSVKLSILHPGVNNKIFRKLPVAVKKYDFIFVGRLSSYKNVDFILKCFQGLLAIRRFESSKLAIVGSGEEKDHLEILCTTLGINGNVDFIGNSSDRSTVNTLLNNSKVFISLSNVETFGLAPLEAMSVGLSCILANSAAFPELIDSSCGWLVDPASETEVRQAMIDALSGTTKLKQKTDAAQKKARKFRWEATADKYLSLLSE